MLASFLNSLEETLELAITYSLPIAGMTTFCTLFAPPAAASLCYFFKNNKLARVVSALLFFLLPSSSFILPVFCADALNSLDLQHWLLGETDLIRLLFVISVQYLVAFASATFVAFIFLDKYITENKSFIRGNSLNLIFFEKTSSNYLHRNQIWVSVSLAIAFVVSNSSIGQFIYRANDGTGPASPAQFFWDEFTLYKYAFGDLTAVIIGILGVIYSLCLLVVCIMSFQATLAIKQLFYASIIENNHYLIRIISACMVTTALTLSLFLIIWTVFNSKVILSFSGVTLGPLIDYLPTIFMSASCATAAGTSAITLSVLNRFSNELEITHKRRADTSGYVATFILFVQPFAILFIGNTLLERV